jgi:hypothetical protein
MIARPCLLALTALVAACSSAPAMHHPTQLPDPVPPANSDFDSIAVPPPTCLNGWQITLVPRIGSDPRWANGPDGKMHIMFIGYGAGQTALRHVTESDAQAAETVSTLGLGSLAIAPDGSANAFLAARSGLVQSPDSVGIIHVSRKSDGWAVDPTEVSSDGGMFNASAIDNDGHTHLAFGDGGLFYASNASGQWVKAGIGTQTQVSVFALEVDHAGHVHIWFSGVDQGATDARNHWASNASGTWQIMAMPDSDAAPAIDRRGVPHLITSTGQNGGLIHLWRENERWSSEPLPALGNASVFDVGFDDNGKLHVVLESNSSAVAYATNASGSWTLEQVIASDAFGLVPSGAIGIDHDGKPHIAFKGPVSGASFGFAQRCP